MSEEIQEATIEVEEVQPVENSLTPEEQRMAEEHGLIPKEEVVQEEKSEEILEEKPEKPEEPSVEEVTQENEQKEEKKVEFSEDLDEKFEEMSKNHVTEHEELTKFDKTQKAWYWKWKNDKKKRQEAEARSELMQVELNALKAQLQNIDRDPLDDVLAEDEAEKPITRKEYEEDRKKAHEALIFERAVKQRIADHNAEAKNKYSDYDQVVNLANDVIKSDVSGTYVKLFVDAAENPQANSAEVMYAIGKLHPKYGKTPEVVKSGEEKANKIKENAQKGVPSTAIPENQKGKRNIPEAELTAADCAGMTTAKWRTLKPETRARILKESCA